MKSPSPVSAFKAPLRRRIARARAAELERRVEHDVNRFLEQFPPEIPVLKPIQVYPTALPGFDLEQALNFIASACPKKLSPITIERPFMEAFQRIQQDKHPNPAAWLLGRALQYYELTQTWDAAEQKYIKTPAKFFEDRVYDEDLSLWDHSSTPATGGKSGRNTGTKHNSGSRGRADQNRDALCRAFPDEPPAPPAPDSPIYKPADGDPRPGS